MLVNSVRMRNIRLISIINYSKKIRNYLRRPHSFCFSSLHETDDIVPSKNKFPSIVQKFYGNFILSEGRGENYCYPDIHLPR